MVEGTPLPGPDFTVDWAKLNNELFATIYANAELHARYERADWLEAQEICAEQFDVLVKDVADFVARFIVLDR